MLRGLSLSYDIYEFVGIGEKSYCNYLTFLSNHIKNEIMNLPNTLKGKDRISTKAAIKIAQEPDWEIQNERWEKLS